MNITYVLNLYPCSLSLLQVSFKKLHVWRVGGGCFTSMYVYVLFAFSAYRSQEEDIGSQGTTVIGGS